MKKICIDIKIRSLYADTICRRSNIMQSHWQNREREVNFSALSFNCPARQASRCNDRVNRIKSESNVQKFKFVFQCNLQFITVAGLPFVMEIGSFYKLKANVRTTKLSRWLQSGCPKRATLYRKCVDEWFFLAISSF